MTILLQAKLRVYNSKWTQSFSLDTVASNGVIVCKDKERNRKYQVKQKSCKSFKEIILICDMKVCLGQSFLIFRFTVPPTNDFLVLEKK